MNVMPKRLLILLVFSAMVSLCMGETLTGQNAQVVAVFPLALARGDSSQVEIWGYNLEGVYAVWFATQGVGAKVKSVERVDVQEFKMAEQSEKLGPVYRAMVELRVDELARVGRHGLRVISPQGMSNVHPFVVTNKPVSLQRESELSGKDSQLVQVPALISGRLREKGEADYYTFEAFPGQEMSFQAVSNQATKSGGFDAMQLTLYEPGGSWFDASRPTRLCFSDEARMTYKFMRRNRYVLQVSGFVGISGPDVVYLLEIAPAESSVGSNQTWNLPDLQTPGIELVKREFRRHLEPKRVEMLLDRTVATPRPQVITELVPVTAVGQSSEDGRVRQEAKTAVTAAKPLDGSAPRLEPSRLLFLEGAIDRPGKVDSYRLTLKAGQHLAFEVETPEATLPEFNPRLDLLDAEGGEVFNNIWRRVGGDNNQWMKTLQAKTIYGFNRDGEYTLRVQDITPRGANSSFKYRILVRPIVPHVGKVAVKEDSVNLAPGRAKRLTVTVEQEEGYTGEVALSVDNLPKGVQALTSAEVPPDPEPLLDQGKRDQYVPKSQKVVLLLVGSQDAPPTTLPQIVQLVARPVVQGQVGAPVWIEDIPVMVVKGDSAEGTGKGL